MTQKRKQARSSQPAQPTSTPAITAATLPQAEMPVPETAPAVVLADGRIFWRLLGGVSVTVVSVICVAVYLQMQNQLHALRQEVSTLSQDLRKDLARLGENHAAMIKKDDHNNRLRLVWDTIKELREGRSDLITLKERCNLLMEVIKSGEDERKAQLAEVRKLREKQSAEEERDAITRQMHLIRDRIKALERPSVNEIVPASHR